MQSYFQKVKGSALSMAKQGMQLLSTVKTEVLSKDAATTSGNTVKSNETSSSAEALAQTYVQLTATLDGLILDSPIESESQKSAKVSGGSSFYHEEKLLLQSPAKGLLLKLIQLLQQESQSWQRSHISDIDLLDMDSIAMPCIGFFLQHKIVSKLCDRAILDRPQGVLVLVVSWLAKLLESVKYPLLPIVHKPVARLVAMVVRYDAMHGIDLYADPRGAAQASNSSGCVVHEQHGYQRRLESALVPLLAILWKKITENPPMLDYFTFVDSLDSKKKAGDSHTQSKGSSLNSHHLHSINGQVSCHGRISPSSTDVLLIMNRSTTAQMDILSVLARMSLRLKLGRAARKVLLSALTLHDSRVDAFLIYRTDFFHNLLTELSKQFTVAAEKATNNFATIAIQSLSAVGDAKQIALSPKSFLSRPGFNASAADMRRTSSSSNTMDSLESPANGMLKDRSPFSIVDSKHSLRRGNQQSSSTSKLKDSIEGAVEDSSRSAAGSIEAFRQLLRFFVTVFTHLHSKPWNSKTMDNELELQECSANPHLKPLSLYFSVFLVETLQPLLLAQSQNCNLACNVLLMYLLRDLRDLEGKDTVLSIEVAHSTRNSANKLNCISEQQSLLTTTIIFLCDQTLLSNSSASSLNLQIYKERALISSPIGGPIEQCSDSSSLILQLVERLGSISKSVAASSSQLLSCLLAVAPLSLARQILMTSLENNRQAVQTNHQNNNPSESPISRNKLDFQEESARVVEVKASSSITKESSVVGSSSPNFQNTSGEYSHTTTSEMGYISLDYKLTAVVGKLSVTAFSSLLYCLQTEIAENKELGARTGTSDVDGRVYFQRYEDSAASAILHRLDAVIANVLESGPITMVKSTGDGVNVLPGMVGAEVNIFRGVLLHHESIILRKLLDRLQSLLAMKADEQVMTSLLLRECLSILCAYLVISPNSVDGSKILQPATVDRVISLELEYILTIIAAVETQWQEVIRYAKKIPDVVRKVCAVKHAMLRQAHAVNYSFSNSVDSSASTNSIEKDKNVSSGLDMGSPSPSVRSETVYHKIMGFPFSSKADQTMRKVIENDSAQSITILESLVMIYEIRCEISGYLFAARKLRKKIAESTSGDGLIGGASMTENWWETLEASNRRIFNIHSPLLQEVAGDGRHVIQSKMGPIVSAIQLFSPGKTPAHESFSDIHIRHSEVHGKIEEASTTQSMVTSEEEGYTEVFHAVIEDEQLQDFQETASVLAMLAIRQAPPSSASKIRLDYLSEGQYSDLSKGIFWTGLEESEAEFLAEYDQLEATLRKITDSED